MVLLSWQQEDPKWKYFSKSYFFIPGDGEQWNCRLIFPKEFPSNPGRAVGLAPSLKNRAAGSGTKGVLRRGNKLGCFVYEAWCHGSGRIGRYDPHLLSDRCNVIKNVCCLLTNLLEFSLEHTHLACSNDAETPKSGLGCESSSETWRVFRGKNSFDAGVPTGNLANSVHVGPSLYPKLVSKSASSFCSALLASEGLFLKISGSC